MRAELPGAADCPDSSSSAKLNDPVPIPSLADDESQRLSARIAAIARAMAACDGVDEFRISGWLPDRFFALLNDLYDTYDAYIAHNLNASELKIQCRFGCTRCCHQAVHGVYSFEIINLHRTLRARVDFAEIHDAFVAYADQFEATVAQISEADDGDPADPVLRALDAFAAAAQPCPLLLGNNCRVHADRPAACRMYHSLTAPVYCTTAQGRTFHIEMPQQANEILWTLSDRLIFPFSTFLAQGIVTLAARQASAS
jgi:Fe-S-cluster containining protein